MALQRKLEKETIRMLRRVGWPKKPMPGVMPEICPRGPGAQEGRGLPGVKAFPKDTPALAFRCKCRDDVDARRVRSESYVTRRRHLPSRSDWKGSIAGMPMISCPCIFIVVQNLKKKNRRNPLPDDDGAYRPGWGTWRGYPRQVPHPGDQVRERGRQKRVMGAYWSPGRTKAAIFMNEEF